MAWKGIVGVGMTVPEFRSYVAGLEFRSWKPSFMVLHNTAAPTLAQWNAYPEHKRILNLEDYYKNKMGWSSGPHLFVDDNTIWVFTPLTTPGTHTPSWNGISLGVELVGDYSREDDDRGPGFNAKMMAVAAFAILHAKLGLNPDTIKLHKEDKRTTHDCPGKNIDKAEFIELVREYMGEGGEHAAEPIHIDDPVKPERDEEKPPPEGKVADSVGGEGLNLREGSSASSRIMAVLPKGARVAIMSEAMNGTTKWLRVWARNNGVAVVGWVSARYIDPQ